MTGSSIYYQQRGGERPQKLRRMKRTHDMELVCGYRKNAMSSDREALRVIDLIKRKGTWDERVVYMNFIFSS